MTGLCRMNTWRTVLATATFLVSCFQVAAADEPGFVPLFDGKSLAGWIGATNGYKVEDGTIVCIPEKGGNLLSEREYGDFDLKLEFRLAPHGNNGIAIRAPREGHVATLGMEIQVLDNTHAKYATLAPYQYHGSVYGVIPAKRGYLRPVGEWNEQEIRCRGSQVTVILNGETIVDGDVLAASRPHTLDGKDHPGLKRTTGHVGFLGHGEPVAFRNIRIKPL